MVFLEIKIRSNDSGRDGEKRAGAGEEFVAFPTSVSGGRIRFSSYLEPTAARAHVHAAVRVLVSLEQADMVHDVLVLCHQTPVAVFPDHRRFNADRVRRYHAHRPDIDLGSACEDPL